MELGHGAQGLILPPPPPPSPQLDSTPMGTQPHLAPRGGEGAPSITPALGQGLGAAVVVALLMVALVEVVLVAVLVPVVLVAVLVAVTPVPYVAVPPPHCPQRCPDQEPSPPPKAFYCGEGSGADNPHAPHS